MIIVLLVSPDPTLKEGKGSGDFGLVQLTRVVLFAGLEFWIMVYGFWTLMLEFVIDHVLVRIYTWK